MDNDGADIVTFPHAAVLGAGCWWRIRTRMLEWLGAILNYLGMPGAVRDVELYDQVTGTCLKVRTTSLFTRISINGRDFYFSRLTGEFDGTGSGCR
jgi:hypothetical protein